MTRYLAASVLLVVGFGLDAIDIRSATSATPDPVAAAVQRADDSPPDTRRVMVVGNSIGFLIGAGMREIEAEQRVVVLDRALLSCTYPPGVAAQRYLNGRVVKVQRGCTRTWADDVRRFRPQVAMLILAEPGEADYRMDGRWTRPCERRYTEHYRKRLTENIRTLRRHGAEVVVTTAPYAVFDAFSAAARRRADCVNRLRRSVARAAHARVADLFAWTCPEPPACRASEDGVVLRTDGVHFRDGAARIVARWLLVQAHLAPATRR